MSRDTVLAFIGVPFDGAATLGWPGARYAPAEVRRHLGWMRMRVQDREIYWNPGGQPDLPVRGRRGRPSLTARSPAGGRVTSG
jgi:hypothetical protein